MKKLFLIKNPELFQGEKHLSKSDNYFEGWYFKNTNNKVGVSFIPGININEKKKCAFIQVITDNNSYYVNYSIDEFEFSNKPFYIKIGNNFFSKENVHIDINDTKQELVVYGDIKYSDSENINTSLFNPNIMGIFSYVPFMECNHAIICMKSRSRGLITINNKKIKFDGGISYIEKDWGVSFPKTYIWCQGNDFKHNDASFMLSIADIPFKIFNFRGVICSLILGNKEYRFATYNNCRIAKCDTTNNSLHIVLKKGSYSLIIKSRYESGQKLSAPVKGNMTKDIFESITSLITVTLKRKNKVIFHDTSRNCGLEIV